MQLLNNFLNYSILLKQIEDQANLVSDGKDLQYLSVQECSYSLRHGFLYHVSVFLLSFFLLLFSGFKKGNVKIILSLFFRTETICCFAFMHYLTPGAPFLVVSWSYPIKHDK